ncbi:MAG: ABC transporter permease [Deltaproteobacteria bacterium]|nr:ABC transporter permease [Deltaproteobacteria bacterium]
MAHASVRRQWRKSLSTLLVMMGGVVACNTLYGYVRANLEMTRDAFIRWGARGHIIVESPMLEGASQEDAPKSLLGPATQKEVDKILSAEPKVRTFARLLEISGMVTNGKTTAIFAGVGEDVEQIRSIKGPSYEYDVVAGQPLWETKGRSTAILGQELARILGCQVPQVGFRALQPGEKPEVRQFACGDAEFQLSTLTVSGQLNAGAYPVSGIMDWGIKEINQRLVVMPIADAQALMGTDGVSKYHVELTDEKYIPEVQSFLEREFKAKGLDLKVYTWSDRATFYHQVRGLLLGFFFFVLAIGVVISFMSLMNTSYVNVFSRIRELGTLRSLGFSKRFVLFSCGLENAQLAVLAGAVGLAVSAAITHGVRSAGWTWVPPGSSNAIPITIAWTPAVYGASVLVLVAIATLAALFPARKVARKEIREALSDL